MNRTDGFTIGERQVVDKVRVGCGDAERGVDPANLVWPVRTCFDLFIAVGYPDREHVDHRLGGIAPAIGSLVRESRTVPCTVMPRCSLTTTRLGLSVDLITNVKCPG